MCVWYIVFDASWVQFASHKLDCIYYTRSVGWSTLQRYGPPASGDITSQRVLQSVQFTSVCTHTSDRERSTHTSFTRMSNPHNKLYSIQCECSWWHVIHLQFLSMNNGYLTIKSQLRQLHCSCVFIPLTGTLQSAAISPGLSDDHDCQMISHQTDNSTEPRDTTQSHTSINHQSTFIRCAKRIHRHFMEHTASTGREIINLHSAEAQECAEAEC